MHTSTRLHAADFAYWQARAGASRQVDFATFSPDYHAQDRVGVVSLGLEEGVLQSSHALLALTTAFYDQLRACHDDFFDYPQHFAFVGAEMATQTICVGNHALPADTPQLWNAWSWLDVWPDAKWVPTAPRAGAMLRRVFDYQINRLFWPRHLMPHANPVDDGLNSLPAYLWKMLKTHLKAVYLYGESGGAAADALPEESFEIRIEPAAQEIVQESVVQLPAPLLIPGSPHALAIAQAATTPQHFQRISVEEFLATWQAQLVG